jgi:hypothetical protein
MDRSMMDCMATYWLGAALMGTNILKVSVRSSQWPTCRTRLTGGGPTKEEVGADVTAPYQPRVKFISQAPHSPPPSEIQHFNYVWC